MEFRILGPVEVRAPGGRLALGGVRDRRVLAVLLLQPGRTVPVSRLVDAVWERDPPATAVKQVRNSVSRLRGLLGPARIHSQPDGYRIVVADGELDAQVFRAALADADRLTVAGEVRRAGEVLAGALELWRGPAVAGLGGPLLESAAAALEERRAAAREAFFDCELALGRHGESVAGLTLLVGEQPLREKSVGQLMCALHRCGRRGDALAVFREFRARLADELGLDPSGELCAAHQRILADEPAAPFPQPPVTVPRQLPLAPRQFTGRAAELDALDRFLDDAESGPIAVIHGSAGIGKTALALYWAQRAAARFPDGQLYVNLRGFDPSGVPVAPAEAVRGFLDAFGVEPGRVPTGLDAQAALFRSLVAGQRILVVLDNVRDIAQVRPLLPGSARCVTVLTSRNHLTGLAVVEGAQPLALGLLTDADAVELLRGRLGAARVAAEVAAASELIALCAHLPLALNIAAARAATRPRQPLADLVAELRDTDQRLDLLAADDVRADARAVFSWSCRALGEPAARMFRLLGAHPGPDIAVPAAASLAGVSRRAARLALGELAAGHLVEERAVGRYEFHDLLRAYVVELAQQDADHDRRDAVRRLVEHYLHTAHAARRLLYPGWRWVELPAAVEPVCPEALPDRERALAWCAAEHESVTALVERAARAGWHRAAWQLAVGIAVFLERVGHWRDWVRVSEIALAAARDGADLVGQAYAQSSLGFALLAQGERAAAETHLREALRHCHLIGDQQRQGAIHLAIGQLREGTGDYPQALTEARRAWELYRDTGFRPGEASALNNLGCYYTQLGDVASGLSASEQALALFRAAGDAYGEAHALDSIAQAHHRLGRHAEAIAHYQRCVALCHDLTDRYREATTLVRLGDAHLAVDDPDAARAVWQRAQTILTELDRPEAAALRTRLSEHHPAACPANTPPGPVGRPTPRPTPSTEHPT